MSPEYRSALKALGLSTKEYEIVADLIKCYDATLSSDPELANADFEGFCNWAWSDDEPLATYPIDRADYQDCLWTAYSTIHERP